MKLIANGCEYECVSATKTENEVKIVDINGETATFSGIENISDYVLEGGDWTEPGPTQLDRVEAQAVYTAMMTDTLLEV